MTDAPVDLDQATEDLWLLRNLLSGFADEPLKRLAAVVAELRAARTAPPADEVAGLLEDVLAIRRHVGGGHGGERRVDMSHRLDRIENHLKGKR